MNHKFLGFIILIVLVFGVFLAFRLVPKLFKELKFGVSSSEPQFESQLKEVPPAYAPVSEESSIKEELVEPKVRISNVSPKGFFQDYSQVVLSVTLAKDKRLDITGWKIKTNKDYWIIPQAAEIYGSSAGDIYIRDGDRVTIYSHGNNLNASFRLNKCIGYIRGLNPENPNWCPYIERSEISHLSGLCQDYILSLGSCEVPAANPPVAVNDAACHEFLSKLNYASCVAKHRDGDDFFDDEWRIWMTSYGNQEKDIFDSYHDRVQIIDKSGKVMDEYTY